MLSLGCRCRRRPRPGGVASASVPGPCRRSPSPAPCGHRPRSTPACNRGWKSSLTRAWPRRRPGRRRGPAELAHSFAPRGNYGRRSRPAWASSRGSGPDIANAFRTRQASSWRPRVGSAPIPATAGRPSGGFSSSSGSWASRWPRRRRLRGSLCRRRSRWPFRRRGGDSIWTGGDSGRPIVGGGGLIGAEAASSSCMAVSQKL